MQLNTLTLGTLSPQLLRAGKLVVLVGPEAEREAMLEMAARLSLIGLVRVLDGGNRFNALKVARHIRRYTPDVERALANIRVARAFTCYQIITLFNQAPGFRQPVLVLDLLDTFYDEGVSLEESRRLLAIIISRLRNLAADAPVAVSLRPAPRPQWQQLQDLVAAAAEQLIIRETPAPPESLRLL